MNISSDLKTTKTKTSPPTTTTTPQTFRLVTLFENLSSNEKNCSEFIDEIKKTPSHELNLEAQDLVPKLCSLIRPKTRRKILNTCITALLYLVNQCDPKILLLILLEEVHEKTKLKDILFLNLLEPIFICLKRIDFPKSNAINVAFKDLYSRIEYLELPKDFHLENKERHLLQFDTTTQTILKWLVPLHNHVEDFLIHSLDRLQSKSFQIKEIAEFLRLEFKILAQPLAYFDLSHDQETSLKTKTRVMAESCLTDIHSIQCNSIKLLEFAAEQNEISSKRKDTEVTSPDDDKFPLVGCAVYSYLVFSEGLMPSNFPAIYTPNYLFQFNLRYISVLLQQPDVSLLTYKGLELFVSLLKKLSAGMWSSDYLECKPVIELLKELMYIANMTKSIEFHQKSLQILATVVKAFQLEARSKIYYFLLSKAPRQKVVGFVITLFKDEIVENFDKKEAIAEMLELEKLYQIIFSLPKGEKSDLLEYSEQVMGALNLLRFLVQFDKPGNNFTHIWNLVPVIEEKYFKILGSGIELSRCHYKLEIKKIMDSRSEKIASGIPVDDGSEKLTDSQRIGFLKKAVHTFTMMEEILGKVSSVVQIEKNKVDLMD